MTAYVDKTYLNNFWENRVKETPKQVNYQPSDVTIDAETYKKNDGFDTNDQTVIGAVNELTYLGQRTEFTQAENSNAFKTTIKVGGIDEDTVIDNEKVVDILKKMLCPYIYEGKPSITVSATAETGSKSFQGPGLPDEPAKIIFSVGSNNITLHKHEYTDHNLTGKINGETVVFGKDDENNDITEQKSTNKSTLSYTYYWVYDTTDVTFKSVLNYGAVTDGTAEDKKTYGAGSVSGSSSPFSISTPNWLAFFSTKNLKDSEYWDETTGTFKSALSDLVRSYYASTPSKVKSYATSKKSFTNGEFTLDYPTGTSANTPLYVWFIVPNGSIKPSSFTDSMGNAYPQATAETTMELGGFDTNNNTSVTLSYKKDYTLPGDQTKKVERAWVFDVYVPCIAVQQSGSNMSFQKVTLA